MSSRPRPISDSNLTKNISHVEITSEKQIGKQMQRDLIVSPIVLLPTVYIRGISKRGFGDLDQVQGQDQDQGQGQDHVLLQRSALPQFLVLALTVVLVLTLDLAQIIKPPFAKPPVVVYSR